MSQIYYLKYGTSPRPTAGNRSFFISFFPILYAIPHSALTTSLGHPQ